MPRIQVSESQNLIEIDLPRIERVASRILSALEYTDVELSLLFVDDEEMADFNLRFRGIEGPTDVLSFPMWEGDFADVCTDMLGDVVISAPTADLMSREHGVPLAAVLDLLLVHGILHLVGYDHETGEDEARLMEEKTLELLAMMGHAPESMAWYLRSEE